MVVKWTLVENSRKLSKKEIERKQESQFLADIIVTNIEDTLVCECCGRLFKNHTDNEAYECAMKILEK